MRTWEEFITTNWNDESQDNKSTSLNSRENTTAKKNSVPVSFGLKDKNNYFQPNQSWVTSLVLDTHWKESRKVVLEVQGYDRKSTKTSKEQS